MSIFDGLNMIGGLCLFLFGMNLMGQALEKPRRRQDADAAGQDDRQKDDRFSDGSGHHGGDSELVGHHGHGRRLRQFRAF